MASNLPYWKPLHKVVVSCLPYQVLEGQLNREAPGIRPALPPPACTSGALPEDAQLGGGSAEACGNAFPSSLLFFP